MARGDATMYSRLGASADKSEVHAALRYTSPGISSSLFCKVLPDVFAGDSEYCVISHADGAGTKAALAYMLWKETGNLGVFRGVVQDSIVMNTDDLACVGAFGPEAPMVVSSSVERNKSVIPGEVVAELIRGTEEFLQRLRDWGAVISSAGGETADVGDLARTLIVNHTITTRMPRSRLLDTASICDGDVIVGVASWGKSSYENCENSGIGSNGLTLARHALLSAAVRARFPESFDPALGQAAYNGSYELLDLLPGSTMTIGEALLSPTRCYLPVISGVHQELGSDLHAMIHCTGGGQGKAGGFLASRGLRCIKDALFTPPAIFRAIQRSAAVSWEEMYRVFNMGHRLEVYCPARSADKVISVARSFNIEAQVVGRVERGTATQLITPEGCFEYQHG